MAPLNTATIIVHSMPSWLLNGGFGAGIVFAVIAGILIIALIIWAAIRAHKANEERIRQLAMWAQSCGLVFSRPVDRGLHQRFPFVDHFQQGSNPYSRHVVTGSIDIVAAGEEGSGIPLRAGVVIFDFHYETYSTNNKGQRTTHHHWSSHCVLELPIRFPHELKVRPENFLDKIGGFVGFGDINFESAEFSRRYHVKATDRKFAYDVLHPLMMEYLLSLGGVKFELEGHVLMRTADRMVRQPAEYEHLMATSAGIIERLPGWLVSQHGGR